MNNQQGKPLSEEQKFYINWGQETVKNNIKLSNDILKQLISLNSAILGFSIIFDTIVLDKTFEIIVLFTFFLSLIVSLIGLLPYEKKVNLDTPEEIKVHKNNALNHKRKFLWISAFLMLAGFAIVLGLFIVKQFFY